MERAGPSVAFDMSQGRASRAETKCAFYLVHIYISDQKPAQQRSISIIGTEHQHKAPMKTLLHHNDLAPLQNCGTANV